MVFRFTTGFVWNGADNVLIDLSRDDVGNYSYGGLFIRTGLASRMLAGWSDSGAVWPFDTGLTLSIVDAIPELRFVWTAP
ncbi:MAG TPA: hypothetical protein VNM14_24785 [Planctomycetota bacterium]|jgi:hypothetical protein|nr:hypothetical protein [Planctomycetota bacterium]